MKKNNTANEPSKTAAEDLDTVEQTNADIPVSKPQEDGKADAKKKQVEIDDGRTIAEMNVDGFPWYDKHKDQRRNYTKKERRQILKAAYMRMLPVLGIMMLGMALAGLFMWAILGF